ncbi:outer envelope membrane protein 7 [Dioscorea cayenensis subsp. rotundata]|uniref:Outer envelope membrane protein 7 n=1 Tax=Dioscorea cayennensis subsp. rotundata TaxID=55577 RepID=A0AB40CK24_DIOCR|nr:outer envelope membrane protein 7 [Dioscorea cayenensis subsp. rotundata]
MAAITSAVVAIAAVILGWITIEIACKPCLEKGREAIDRSLDPNYDPDSPISAPNHTQPLLDPTPSAPPISTTTVKTI